jgi:quercetin dioxygenase-like cupin family protein
MTAGEPTTLTAFALSKGDGEALWFGDGLATIKASGEATGGRCTVIEFFAPKGHAPPLHVHRREDEWFYVLEGELLFWVNGQKVQAGPDSFVYAPRNIPHTFMVTSPTARFVLVAQPAGFDRFVRALAAPAQTRTLPPKTLENPSPDRMMAAAAQHEIEILGPPGIPS